MSATCRRHDTECRHLGKKTTRRHPTCGAKHRSCTTTPMATIDNSNINIVHSLYAQPTTNEGHPEPILPHQQYDMPGDICDTIRHSNRRKANGVNADSTDIFIDLVKTNIPQVLEDLRYIFNQIYINNIPTPIQHFFSDVYLFCLHKDINDASNYDQLEYQLPYDKS